MKKIMKLSIEEKLMYEVMMAIYESGKRTFGVLTHISTSLL